MTTFGSTGSRLALAAGLVMLSLSACKPQPPTSGSYAGLAATDTAGQPVNAAPMAALPLATAVPVLAVFAPVTLPFARALRVASNPRAERYRYIDRAAEFNRGFANTPPDYTVDYQGTRPWVWRSNNGAYRVVERLPQGQRDYYYQTGLDQPFYVSDPQGGYAYDNGNLVAAYGPDGLLLGDAYAAQRADAAAAYYDRARALYRAAQYDRRQAAYAADWQERQASFAARQAAFDNARARDTEWQAWHDRHADDERRRWDDERNRRIAYAAAIGVGVGAVAVIATRGHDNQNHGGDPRNDLHHDRFAPGADGGFRQVGTGSSTNEGAPGQVALAQQQAARDAQRRQAAMDARRAATVRQAADIAASRAATDTQRRAATDEQRAALQMQRAVADAQARARAQQNAASDAQRVAAARQQAPVTVESRRASTVTAADQAQNTIKRQPAAKQAIDAQRAQAQAAIGIQREATNATAREKARSAREAQRVAAAAGAAKVRDAQQVRAAADRQAGDAARARSDASARQQSHAAIEAQRMSVQADAAKTAAANRTQTADAQRQRQVKSRDAAHAADETHRKEAQSGAPGRKAAVDKGKGEKGDRLRPGEQPK